MSRQWKKPPTHLPGWNQYQPLERKRRKQTVAEKRDWKKRKRGILTRRRRRALDRPFPHHQSPTLKKVLHIQGNGSDTCCLFKRQHGRWHCLIAPDPFDWFTRIHDMNLIGNWLRRQHYEFHWLPFTPDTAYNSLAGPTQGAVPETRPAASPSSIIPPTHARPDAPVSGGLEQNGITKPRCLIAGDVPGTQDPTH